MHIVFVINSVRTVIIGGRTNQASLPWILDPGMMDPFLHSAEPRVVTLLVQAQPQVQPYGRGICRGWTAVRWTLLGGGRPIRSGFRSTVVSPDVVRSFGWRISGSKGPYQPHLPLQEARTFDYQIQGILVRYSLPGLLLGLSSLWRSGARGHHSSLLDRSFNAL